MSIFYVPENQENENIEIEKIENNLNKLSAKVGNPTSSNSNNEIVKRDASGGFAAGIIQSSGLSDGNNLILQTTGTLTRLGVNSGPTMSGINNTVIGTNAMNANSSGFSNCCVGSSAGGSLTKVKMYV